MADEPLRELHCPTCKKLVPKDSPDSPFCGERCRLIDLGKWASGAYKISSPLRDTDEGPGGDSDPEDS